MKRLIFIFILSILLSNTLGLVPVKAKKTTIPIMEPYILVVKKGDNLYRLSKKYHTSIEDFKKLNNLKSNTIYVGQRLKTNISDCSKLIIPKNKEINTFYDKDKNLKIAVWYDNSKGIDVQAIFHKNDTSCSKSVKRLIAHVEQTN